MNFNFIAKRAEKLIVDNAPVILTGVGIVGTVATAYLTGKASFRAAEILREEADRRITDVEDPIDKKGIALLTWKLYAPAVGSGALTITAIVFAHRITTKRVAAMAMAYALSEKTFGEYKEKVKEHFGDGKAQKAHDEAVQDRISANPPNNVIVTGGGDVLFFDEYTSRYFTSTVETIKKAQNDLNYMLLSDGYASLTDFYDRIGLGRTKFSDEFGWNSDKLLEVSFTTTMSDDEKPCIALDFDVVPVRNYFRTH